MAKKMSAARRRQLRRVRKLVRSLAQRGFSLPPEAWRLSELTTQKLAAMTPDWFYARATYRIKAEDFAIIANSGKRVDLPGTVVSGARGRWIEWQKRSAKRTYPNVGRMYEIANDAIKRQERPIGANVLLERLDKLQEKYGLDKLEYIFRTNWATLSAAANELARRDYEALKAEQRKTGKSPRDILNTLDRIFENQTNAGGAIFEYEG